MSKKTKVEIAQNALSQMNLSPDEKDPKKKPFVDDRELASQLKMEKTTVYNTRRSLKFARCNKINENCWVVYAWRWKANKEHAKIGKCPIGSLLYRLITTYEPIDNPLLIGVKECCDKKEAGEIEREILNKRFEKTHCKREWIHIKKNKKFYEMIANEFTTKRIDKIVLREEW